MSRRSQLVPLTLAALICIASCSDGDHPTGIRVLGVTEGACGSGSALFGTVPLRLEPEGLGAFSSVSVAVASGGTLAPLRDNEAPFIIDLDTTQLDDGTVTLALRATDTEGEGLSSQLTLCVDNSGPQLTILSPREGASIGIEDARVAVRVSVDDPAGVASVTAKLATAGAHQQVLCQPPDSKEQVCTLRPGELGLAYEPSSKSQITLTVVARDKAGHETTLRRELLVGSRQLWRFNTGAKIEIGPATSANGNIIVGNTSGRVFVVDPSGTELCNWQVPLVNGTLSPITTRITVGMVSGKEHAFFGSSHFLVALNIADCKPLWTRPNQYLSSRPAHDAAADVLYVGAYGNSTTRAPLEAWRASTGQLLGTFSAGPLDRGVRSSPALSADGKTVYVGDDETPTLYALDVSNPASMQARWSKATSAKVEARPLVTPQAIYVAAGSGGHTLHAFAPADGSPLPNFSFVAKSGFSTDPLLGADGEIYVGGQDGMFYSIDTNGKELASFDVGGRMRSAAIGPGNIVYLPKLKPGRLHALTSKLEPLWTAQPSSLADHSIGAPTISGSTVYIGSTTGFLYAFDATPPTSN